MVKPFWVELWEGFLRNRISGEEGPCLGAVQTRIKTGEARCKTTYSWPFRDEDDWDEADHYACFHYRMKSENAWENTGVFWLINIQKNTDMLIWPLKVYLRHIHSPSQIKRHGGGSGLKRISDKFGSLWRSSSLFPFSTTRASWALPLSLVRRTLTSSLPFNNGRMIGDDIPDSQRRRMVIELIHTSCRHKTKRNTRRYVSTSSILERIRG